jgi:uncharacterized protein (DUF849 family)
VAARIERIKACLNGRRDPSAHPALPVTPRQLAESASAAVAAGAEAVHLHPRGADGRESLRSADVGAAVAAVRAACPGVPAGVTTGLWAAAEPGGSDAAGGDLAAAARARQQQVGGWAGLDAAHRPDFASLNLSEEGWQQLATTLADAGIGVEAGVWSVADADRIAGFAPAGGWLRVMVEVAGVGASEAVGYADEILARLAATAPGVRPLLHGEDESCWPLIAHAGQIGLPTRIGLEDVTAGPAGQPVGGNAELVRLALEFWAAAAVS